MSASASLICSVPLIQAGVDDRAVVGREDRADELLQHQADAERREQRLERPAVEKPDDRPLEDHAGQRRDEERRRDGDQESTRRGGAGISACTT